MINEAPESEMGNGVKKIKIGKAVGFKSGKVKFPLLYLNLSRDLSVLRQRDQG